MAKYGITEKGAALLQERIESDPAFKEEFAKTQRKMTKVLPRLLNLTTDELFDEIYDGLRTKDGE